MEGWHGDDDDVDGVGDNARCCRDSHRPPLPLERPVNGACADYYQSARAAVVATTTGGVISVRRSVASEAQYAACDATIL